GSRAYVTPAPSERHRRPSDAAPSTSTSAPARDSVVADLRTRASFVMPLLTSMAIRGRPLAMRPIPRRDGQIGVTPIHRGIGGGKRLGRDAESVHQSGVCRNQARFLR